MSQRDSAEEEDARPDQTSATTDQFRPLLPANKQTIQAMRKNTERFFNTLERKMDALLPDVPDPSGIAASYAAQTVLSAIQQHHEYIDYVRREIGTSEVLAGNISRKRLAEILQVHQATVGRWVKAELDRVHSAGLTPNALQWENVLEDE